MNKFCLKSDSYIKYIYTAINYFRCQIAGIPPHPRQLPRLQLLMLSIA